MNQKNVDNTRDYSTRLYDLYSRGKEACSILQVEIRRLVDSIDVETNMFMWPDEVRRAFEDVFKWLDSLSSERHESVIDILNQILRLVVFELGKSNKKDSTFICWSLLLR